MPEKRESMNWIWLNESGKSCYAEFRAEFTCEHSALLRISASRNYAAFINGEFVCNGQYADLPDYKSVDTVNISCYVRSGINELRIIAYHMDADFATGRVMEAGIAFEVLAQGRLIIASDENTLCRETNYFVLEECVTPQLGYGWGYDFLSAEKEWRKSIPIKNLFHETERPVPLCKVEKPKISEIKAQGIFQYRGGVSSAQKAQNAWMSTLRFFDMTGADRLTYSYLQQPICFASTDGDGIFVIADLGEESVGHVSLSLETDEACKAILVWGEHLSDLRVRSQIESRNFAIELKLQKGKNEWTDYLHRIGGRYLCVFAETHKITVERITVREVMYPFNEVNHFFADRLIQKIYDVSVRTLKLCAHEHYEDCCWREQALYGMDSRNQMLFGYSAFKEYNLPRASLRLFSRSARENGMVELCAPARASIVIPSFTAYVLLAIAENAEADYNEDFVLEMLPFAERALQTFEENTKEDGVHIFTQTCYWNFHEWSAGLDGGTIFRDKEIPSYADGALTALVFRATKEIAALERKLKREKQAEKLEKYAYSLSQSFDKFYDVQMGVYSSYIVSGMRRGWHAYTQALFLLTGLIPERRRKGMVAELKKKNVCVPLTLAALQLKYDAILKTDGDSNYCVKEMCDIFGKMLLSGATSFWETQNGEADFNDAGSLCHGWSSVACWLLDKVGMR